MRPNDRLLRKRLVELLVAMDETIICSEELKRMHREVISLMCVMKPEDTSHVPTMLDKIFGFEGGRAIRAETDPRFRD